MSIIYSNNLTKYDGEDKQEYVDKYIKGNDYVLQVDLNVRSGAGTNNPIKKYNDLTYDGKQHAYKQENAVLMKGTTVTCLDIININNDIWLEIPSGYIAGIYQKEIYIK